VCSTFMAAEVIAMVAMFALPAWSETPEEWLTLGTRVHGGSGLLSRSAFASLRAHYGQVPGRILSTVQPRS
jgi:hypothetical protein